MTLIEMLVALLIVLLMMSFIVTIYLRTMQVRDRTEELAGIQATTNATLGLIRRDLTGSFCRAVEVYEFGGYRAGAEFHWEAPVDTSITPDLSKGFRRLTFLSAMDGCRRVDDPMRPYEYAVVSWAVRGGALFRQVGEWRMGVDDNDPELLACGWDACPDFDDTNSNGVAVGEFVYSDDTAPFEDVGTYRGTPYIKTDPSIDPPETTLKFIDMSGNPVPVTVTVGFEQGRTALPGWASDFRALGEKIKTTSVTFDLYAKGCPEGEVKVGSNAGGAWMYFIMLEPLAWSLDEEAQALVFRSPANQLPVDPDGDGIYTGGIPPYVEAEFTISDPKHPSGKRVFGQRMGIPAGGVL